MVPAAATQPAGLPASGAALAHVLAASSSTCAQQGYMYINTFMYLERARAADHRAASAAGLSV
jgi:hypothetical protein